MIIKSMGRKAGAGGVKGAFVRLVRYMARGEGEESTKNVIWNGFYGNERSTEEEIVRAFEENAQYLKARKNGNLLYHEILSFSSGSQLQGEELERAVTDIGYEYLRRRAPQQLAFGAIHRDTDHIHLHLMISANAFNSSRRSWLTKQAFAQIQKETEAYTLKHYPELGQTVIYDKPRSKERLKTQTNEQAMRSRTGQASRKEELKAKLHQVFERAGSLEELQKSLGELGARLYTRGKSVGVVVRDGEGERKHRLAKLGLEEHYRATEARIATIEKKLKPPQEPQKPPEPSRSEESSRYTDRILDEARVRTAEQDRSSQSRGHRESER